jgi:MFS family permease
VDSSRADNRRHPVTGLATVCLAVVMLPVSLTGAAVAVPRITAEFHSSLAAGGWVVNGYNLTFGAFILATGSLADRFGRRRLFALGSAAFALCSLLAAISGGIAALDAARAAAGVGAAAMLTSGSAILASLFRGRALDRAFFAFGTAAGAGLAFGPFIAGALQTAFGWRAVFLLPAIVGALALGLSFLLPESGNPGSGPVDLLGMASFTGALIALITALLRGPQAGWSSPLNIAAYVLCPGLLAAFAMAELRGREPMFDLRLLRQIEYASLCAAVVALVAGFTPLLVYLPDYFASVKAESAWHAGTDLLMLTLPTLAGPVVASRVLRRVPVRHLVALAVLLTGAGDCWLMVIAPGAGNWTLLGPFLTAGTGFGLSLGVMDGAAVASVEPGRAGMAAGMFNTMRLAGETVAIAVAGALLACITQLNMAAALSGRPSLRAVAALGVAARLVEGQLTPAVSAVPRGLRGGLVKTAAASYTTALHEVLWITAGFCLATALLVTAVGSLSRKRMSPPPAAASSPERLVPSPRFAQCNPPAET